MEIVDLLAILAKHYKEKTEKLPTKTKLIKLAYLAEVYFKRLTGRRLTNQSWIFWKYGPYFKEFENLITDETIFLKPDQTDDFYPIEVSDDYESKTLSLDEKIAVDRALGHAHDDLNEILDFVYFDTEPMIKVQNRGDILDFDSVFPEKYYSIKEYKISDKQRQEIKSKIKEWEAKRRR
jgi:hypothetical protein